MAKQLKTFDFPTKPGGRQEQYPWDNWLNGEIWELTRDEDFTITPENFAKTAYTAARRRDLKVRTDSNQNVLVLQAYESPEGAGEEVE